MDTPYIAHTEMSTNKLINKPAGVPVFIGARFIGTIRKECIVKSTGGKIGLSFEHEGKSHFVEMDEAEIRKIVEKTSVSKPL